MLKRNNQKKDFIEWNQNERYKLRDTEIAQQDIIFAASCFHLGGVQG